MCPLWAARTCLLRQYEIAGSHERERLLLTHVALAKELHAHHGEDEDNDGEHEGEVAQRAHRLAHDRDQQVERRPRLGQLEHAKLEGIKTGIGRRQDERQQR